MTHRHKRINSRAKGARGEREASRYLSLLGFTAERNGRNGLSTDDLVVPGLPNVHVEVKYGVAGMDVGTALLSKAFEQSAAAMPKPYAGGMKAVVLWKPMRKCWRLTWSERFGLVTTAGDDEIKGVLRELDAAGGA